MILLLNVVAPSSRDVRVFKYVVQIVSQVRGRVIEVPVEEGNRPVKKGDVLFRIDPTPYQLKVNTPRGAARQRQREQRELGEQLRRADRRSRAARQHGGDCRGAASSTSHASACTKTASWSPPAPATRFDLEQAETNVRN